MSNDLILYNTDDGQMKIELHLEDGTIWLSQLEIAELFQTTKNNISLHVKNIFKDGELGEKATVKDYLTVQKEGEREVKRSVTVYNLDMILAIAYRVRSVHGAQFRRYASTILKEYLVNGFVIDDEKVTEDLSYFKRLQKRIRDIRSSERLFYQQVLDIFATSIDYDGKTEVAREFFQTVQNKMLHAVTGHTAPELIFSRLDSEKEDLGLTTYKGNYPRKSDLKISKNYLNAKELTRLNLIVSGYLDTAEYQAETQLVEKYGSSFERTKMTRMIKFAELFPDAEIVATLSQQLSWSHFVEIIPLKTEAARMYYAKDVLERNYGVRELRHQISRRAYERSEIANTELSEQSAIPFNVFKDPYLLDILGAKENYPAADLERAILTRSKSEFSSPSSIASSPFISVSWISLEK